MKDYRARKAGGQDAWVYPIHNILL
jgi:hypothetical protein